jgi:2'-5' RNA ligase
MVDAADAAQSVTGAEPVYSLWLLAEPVAQERLVDLVDELAPRFGTRSFTPHVTVQGSLCRRLKDVTAAAAALAASLPAQRVAVRGIEQSTHYFRAFYLAFDGFDAFAPLIRRSAAAFGSDEGLSPFPHLSLAYGTLGADAKAAIAREVAADVPATLAFDRLAVSLSGNSVGIASWRVLQTFALAAPAQLP